MLAASSCSPGIYPLPCTVCGRFRTTYSRQSLLWGRRGPGHRGCQQATATSCLGMSKPCSCIPAPKLLGCALCLGHAEPGPCWERTPCSVQTFLSEVSRAGQPGFSPGLSSLHHVPLQERFLCVPTARALQTRYNMPVQQKSCWDSQPFDGKGKEKG